MDNVTCRGFTPDDIAEYEPSFPMALLDLALKSIDKSHEELGRIIKDVVDEVINDMLDDMLYEAESEESDECPYCFGSGGGYMGGYEPRCPYCRGSGIRRGE